MAVAVSITSSREESDEFFWMPIAGAFCIDVTFDRASKVFYRLMHSCYCDKGLAYRAYLKIGGRVCEAVNFEI